MDYRSVKFGDFSFSRFGFIARIEADRITDADDRYTDAATVGISKKKCMNAM